MQTDLDALRAAFGFGVAGNFAGHLEQAGEAVDFERVVPTAAEAPKGIFPWYVPGDDGFLGTFPLSTDATLRPDGDVHLQIEPEVGLLAAVRYGPDGHVAAFEPQAIGAFNDCSIRREGARKISDKKNWGPASKGVAPTLLPLTDLDPNGPTATFRLGCWLRRDGETVAYGVDSPLPGYSYYGTRLLDWTVERLANQHGSDDTPLEDVGALLRARSPETALIGIGATRYTDLGATTYLEVGDTSIVVVYDAATTGPDEVERLVRTGREDELAAASVLRQDVRAH